MALLTTGYGWLIQSRRLIRDPEVPQCIRLKQSYKPFPRLSGKDFWQTA